MGTTAQKMQAVVNSTNDIRTAINEQGVPVDASVHLAQYGEKIREIRTGGDIIDTSKPVVFYDYDGTPIAAYTLEEARNLTALPPQPSHPLFVPQGWTHSLSRVRGVTSILEAGAMYRTLDGKTHGYITITKAWDRKIYVRIAINGTATIRVEWGDGQTQNITTTSIVSHTYAAVGDYVVKLGRTSGTGTYSLGNLDEEEWGLFIYRVVSNEWGEYVISDFISAIYVGDNVETLCPGAFDSLSLSEVMISKGVKTLMQGAVSDIPRIAAVVVPDSVTSIGDEAVYMRDGLTIIPDSVSVFGEFALLGSGIRSYDSPQPLTEIGIGMFSQCRRLENLVIPPTVTRIGEEICRRCPRLRSVTVPSGVTILDGYAFSGVLLNEIIFESVIPPTAGEYVFDDVSALLKIYVPDASVNAYKTATNLAQYADYFYPISSRP